MKKRKRQNFPVRTGVSMAAFLISFALMEAEVVPLGIGLLLCALLAFVTYVVACYEGWAY
ncbi:MAG: hypothetical protein ACK5JF_02670 [Oscillospiraceae bacterium]